MGHMEEREFGWFRNESPAPLELPDEEPPGYR